MIGTTPPLPDSPRMARTTKPRPVIRSTVVVACFDPPCARFLKVHKDGRFTSVTTDTDATTFKDETEAHDALARYASRVRGHWGSGVVWAVYDMATKVTFVELREALERSPDSPGTQKAPQR